MIQRRHGGGLERMAVVSRTHGVSDSGIEHVAVSVIDYKNRWTVGDGGRAGDNGGREGGLDIAERQWPQASLSLRCK